MDQHFLAPLFQPDTIAVFTGPTGGAGAAGAPTAQAQALTDALRAQRFAGQLVFLDVHTTGTLADLAQTRADLAIIALPADEAQQALEVAGRIKCRAALLIGSGATPDQAASLHRTAKRHGMHLLGPNSLGFQRPARGLNASVVGPLAATGSLALVSQSGSLTAAMLDWARARHIGFSQVVSLGEQADVDVGDLLDHLASDARTRAILLYIESAA
ncbi:MAG: GNAT family N-acetyltransferase, partial [Hydrogenophaga sp.]